MSAPTITESQAHLAAVITANPEVEKSLQRLRAAGEKLSSQIFNTNKSDYSLPQLFLGEQRNGLIDSLHTPYPELMRLYRELQAMDWRHDEYDYSSCIEQFKTCSPSIYRMMIRTLAWQWEGDSTASNVFTELFPAFASCTETRIGYARIGVSENVHALTYAEIVRGSFEDPSVILDEITSVREAHGRMAAVGQIFEQAAIAAKEWRDTHVRTQFIEDAVFMLICGVYMLERIQFMASFAVTFGICSLKLFEPIGTAVQIIARDEWTNHVPFGEEVISQLLKTDWGMAAFERCRPRLIEAHIELLSNEMGWVDYLHSDGDELPGVPPAKLKNWSLFCGRGSTELYGITKEVEAALGVTMPTVLPLSYMADWIDINEKQASPQEQDNNQYLLGVVSTNNISDTKYGFNLRFHHDEQNALTAA